MLRRVALIRIDVLEELSLHHQGDKNRRTRNNVNTNWQPTHAAKKFVTLIMEALSSSETSVLTRATRRNNLEDGILHVYFLFMGSQPSAYEHMMAQCKLRVILRESDFQSSCLHEAEGTAGDSGGTAG
jgi:hypothetical protein